MKRTLVVILIVVAALVAAYFGVATVFGARAANAKRTLRAAGHPADIADLAPLFERGSEEAGSLYTAAAAGFDKHELGRLAHYDTLGWREDPRGLDSLVRAKAEPLGLLLRAAELGPARFGQEYEQGIHARLAAPTGSFGRFHVLLHLHARDLVNKGEHDSALAVLGRAFALTGACAEPLLVYWLVGLIGQDSCLGLVARCAAEASDAALERAEVELASVDPTDAMVRALETEAVMMQAALEQGYQGWCDEQGNTVDFPWMAFLPVRNWVRARQLEFARQSLELAGRPWHESQAALVELDSAVGRTPGIWGRLVRMAVPRLALFQTRNARLIAGRDATAHGLRLLRARRRVGRVVDAVSDDVGPVPADPFSGERLRVAGSADSLVVYSVGPDRVDDDGAGDDITFRTRW